MNRDAIYVEMDDIKQQLGSISPKTELYKRLKARYAELYKKSGSQDIKSEVVKNSFRREWDKPVVTITYTKSKKGKK